jgi:hypothetical protein
LHGVRVVILKTILHPCTFHYFTFVIYLGIAFI